MDSKQRAIFHAKIAKAIARGQSKNAVAIKFNVSLQTVYNVAKEGKNGRS